MPNKSGELFSEMRESTNHFTRIAELDRSINEALADAGGAVQRGDMKRIYVSQPTASPESTAWRVTCCSYNGRLGSSCNRPWAFPRF
jgi:hypothetical protein